VSNIDDNCSSRSWPDEFAEKKTTTRGDMQNDTNKRLRSSETTISTRDSLLSKIEVERSGDLVFFSAYFFFIFFQEDFGRELNLETSARATGMERGTWEEERPKRLGGVLRNWLSLICLLFSLPDRWHSKDFLDSGTLAQHTLSNCAGGWLFGSFHCSL
jgi:hypothetical protein